MNEDIQIKYNLIIGCILIPYVEKAIKLLEESKRHKVQNTHGYRKRVMYILNKTNREKAVIICVFLLIIIFTMAHVSGTSRKIVRVHDETLITFQDMIQEVSTAKVIYIGEQHSEPAHHKTQLDVIQALYEQGQPLAIGIEMFKKGDQHHLDAWVAGKMSEKEFIPLFLENWGYGWNFYRDIFLFAREKKIPLVALNVPQEITRKVGQTGFQSLTDEELSKLPPGVTCELDQQYMDHLVEIFQYKGSTDKSFFFFCEAQVLWDQAMAWHLTDYMKKNTDKTVIVLAGAIHAWKYGIPKQKQRYLSVEQRIIIPDLPVSVELITVDDADYFVVHS